MELNNSRLTTLQNCGERFRRLYVEGEVEPTSPQAIRGSAVHHVARIALRRKLVRREVERLTTPDTTGYQANTALPSLEEAQDLAATEFERRWQAAEMRVMDTQEDGGATLAQARAESKDAAVKLAGLHVTVVAPGIDPIYVERKITVKPQHSDLVIHGTLDLVARESVPLAPLRVIRDLKSGRKAPRRDAADTSQQLSVYGLISAAEAGVFADGLALDHLYKTPTGHLRYVEQRTTRDMADFEAIVNRLNTATQAIEKGIYIPADSSSWFCNAKYCGFYASCPYTRRSKRPTS